MPSKKAPASRGQTKSTGPELDLIRTLADILNETGLSEIELEQKGSRVRVSRTMTVAPCPVPVAGTVPRSLAGYVGWSMSSWASWPVVAPATVAVDPRSPGPVMVRW